VYKDNL